MIEGSNQEIINYVQRMKKTLGAGKTGLVSMAYSTPEDISHTPEKVAVMCNAFRQYENY